MWNKTKRLCILLYLNTTYSLFAFAGSRLEIVIAKCGIISSCNFKDVLVMTQEHLANAFNTMICRHWRSPDTCGKNMTYFFFFTFLTLHRNEGGWFS